MARNFNGTTDQILTSSYAIPAPSVSLCIWLNPGTLSNAYNCLISQNSGSGSTGFNQILLKSTSKFAYYTTCGSGNTVSLDPGSASASGWTHVGFSYDSTNGMLTYVNGVSDGTTASLGTLVSSTVGTTFGYDSATAGRNYPGKLAHGAQWNVALSAAEFKALANGALPYTIRPLNLTLYCPLDGLQSPEPDLSGNARNGTLSGGPPALASGPPVMMFTPRWPMTPLSAASVIFPFQVEMGETYRKIATVAY